jgi:hypothetical protein
VASHHDHLFQVAFGDPEHAVPLLRTALPASLADAIDWRTLCRKNPTQHRRRSRRTLCDLLFSVRTHHQQNLLLYVVLEHKSQSRRFDALQILDQVVGVLRTHRREHPRDRYLPSLHYVLDDLHDVPPERLRRRALSVFGLCALSALQYLPQAARDERAFAAFLDAWHDIQEQAYSLGEARGGRDWFDTLVDYVFATSGLPTPVVQRLLTRRFPDPAMKNKFVSTAQQLRNEGKAEGKAEGQVSTLLRLVARRFGAPDSDVVERVRNGTPEELDRWLDRILDATSVAALFAE